MCGDKASCLHNFGTMWCNKTWLLKYRKLDIFEYTNSYTDDDNDILFRNI